nr:immunoglobulin light chain junction region [Macaca mulatta]MOW58491.1 immunoglobulin light chain junction region [Macaca mulatta]MOW58744.1 immunoglobulin light chain junction region [Macaca mulatta]MOW58983.1 immunoglobulin light chain junction region [Macaca mulatta]MOW60683.1 immunoglobulin light chain junction region [Macaca mulatta]
DYHCQVWDSSSQYVF